MGRRSIIIGGTTTSVFLEDEFWKEIDNRSKKRGEQWYELVREMLDGIDDPKNRSSAIKETLVRTLREECERAKAENITITLEVVTEGNAKKIILNGERCLIGRSEECELQLPESNISRIHAMLVFDTEKWWLIDLESKNGTRLNNKKIKSAVLKSGDVIRIGKVEIKI
ncbi:MAG: FHA domain-containing protein [Gammaproteobacteria bacterium]|nr:MAG: FHA domain-containing protein [Gammaproteobacteria bacterium]